MQMKLLGFKDREFESGMNRWLAENPTKEVRYVTAFPVVNNWWQILLFYDERPSPQKE
jgi:hypothetical protein